MKNHKRETLSLFLAATFFITQSMFLVQSAQSQEPQISSREDSILELANLIEHRGIELQAVADEQDIESAHFLFKENAKRNLSELKATTEKEISTMSPEQSTLFLQNLSITDEWMMSITQNRELTDAQKIKTIYEGMLNHVFSDTLESIQQKANLLGYKKVFQDMADQFRSRGTYKFWTKDFWSEPMDPNDTTLIYYHAFFSCLVVAGMGGAMFGLVHLAYSDGTTLAGAILGSIGAIYVVTAVTIWLFEQWLGKENSPW